MAITLKDIAKKAGVSESTVSRVLNGIPKASSETRDKILKIAKELGYYPNDVARSLAKQKTHIIGLIVSDIANPYFASVIGGVEEVASLKGYSLIISATGGKEKEELKYIKILKEKKVDGIVFMSGRMPDSCEKALVESEIPTVVVSRKVKSFLPSIHIDNIGESYKAVEYLIKLGHRRIAMISGPCIDKESGYHRLLGYKNALADYDLPFEEELVQEGDFKMDSGRKAMENLLSLKKLPTAVFAASDAMGVGAIKAIKKAGLRVPEDISVIGFDNSIISLACDPELTTIGQPVKDLGRTAMEMLYKIIQGEELERRTIYLPCELIIRGSTKSLG
ncbi:hypothetical protein BBF96_10665 [Anoxybacter fermentans]|uniref:Uncharacterized protein n=1 Tax=Anoxybacter fermentans TaxID=1323375 RepID=A0A3S9T317_9FIRM|nr:LacI family DNA-binding transcriptional regulator [Anoxybacter fermentans]AZR74901.1 hypothetical protein BBF96_10665 [Anoxybacter fermentans]